MTTNQSGKLNQGGVQAIKDICQIPRDKRTEQQEKYFEACLTALAHQPERWLGYQDWGPGGPKHYLAGAGILFIPAKDPKPEQRSWYDGCECSVKHRKYWVQDGSGDWYWGEKSSEQIL